MTQTFQRDTQACKNEYAQTKKQIDEQFKKDQRRAKKAKEETGWQALAFFEGSRGRRRQMAATGPTPTGTPRSMSST